MASVAALLDTFVDAESLSRAAALADDMQLQRSKLQEELAAVELRLPTALAAVQSDTRTAIERLGRLADERTALEESVAQQMGVSQQLLRKLEPPLTKLGQLDEARLVLRVLVTADELVRAAQAPPSQVADAADAGATNGALHSLLRLQALRACVAGEEAMAADAVDAGSNAASDSLSQGRAGGQLTRSLLQLLDQRVGRLVATMREPLVARAAEALQVLGWPGEVAMRGAAAEAALQAVRAAFTSLLLLQFCAQPAAEEPSLTAEDAEAATRGGTPATGRLWAVEALVQPVLRRFRFHFEGRRESNRRDKPEWVFTHCTGLLRLHRALLTDSIQPMLVAPLRTLEDSFASAPLAHAQACAYVRMVALRCPHGVYVSLAAALCDAMSAKLTREMTSLLRTPALFSHTLNE